MFVGKHGLTAVDSGIVKFLEAFALPISSVFEGF